MFNFNEWKRQSLQLLSKSYNIMNKYMLAEVNRLTVSSFVYSYEIKPLCKFQSLQIYYFCDMVSCLMHSGGSGELEFPPCMRACIMAWQQFRRGHSTPLCPLHSFMPPPLLYAPHPDRLDLSEWDATDEPGLTRLVFFFFYFLNIYYSFTAYFSFVFLYCRFFWGYFYFLPSPPPHQHAGRRWVLEVTPCALRRRSIRNYVADTDRMQRDKTSNATGAEK